MILISCVDQAMGLRFNHRRQSRDKTLCGRILALAGGTLWLHQTSRALFEPFPDADLREIERPEEAPVGAFCFWEEPVAESLEPEEILLYLWNRDYPGDEFFVFPGGKDRWVCTRQEDFSGFSHPELTEARYIRKE